MKLPPEELGWIKVGEVNKMSNHGVTARKQRAQKTPKRQPFPLVEDPTGHSGTQEGTERALLL